MPPRKKRLKTSDSVDAGGGDTKQGRKINTTIDWNKKTVTILKNSCRKRGLDSSGNKQTLIQRLIENNSEDSDDVPDANTNPVHVLEDDNQSSAPKKPKRNPKTDERCTINAQVLEDYDCMLNQTNINANNNKFYLIQLLKTGGKNEYFVWTRWGRVGEIGQNNLCGPLKKVEDAIKEFEKKFKDKTKNDWENRNKFVPKKGKYTLLEMDDEDDDGEDADGKVNVKTGNKKPCVFEDEVFAGCSLDQPTKELISLLFDDDMYVNSMAAMELDVKKMPLGKLSKTQISKGFDALIAIEDAIKAKKALNDLEKLTSAFFTLIPHSFGRNRPPLIDTIYLVQKKKDMLLVLSDIELAQNLQKKNIDIKKVKVDTLKPHPIDEKYNLLQCKLTLLKRSSDEHKVIEKYMKMTTGTNWKIRHIWKVDRDGEGERFKEHDKLKNRKLLWHGTNVAVVAAILNSGLRIMPHSGGRVGRGIYFASEHSKSAGFVHFSSNRVGIMFLTEVALGTEKNIINDNHKLTAAPKGFDSVVARGQTEPDPSDDISLEFDDKNVTVPQGAPIKTKYEKSSFYQSEYLIYKESQARIRYLITF